MKAMVAEEAVLGPGASAPSPAGPEEAPGPRSPASGLEPSVPCVGSGSGLELCTWKVRFLLLAT